MLMLIFQQREHWLLKTWILLIQTGDNIFLELEEIFSDYGLDINNIHYSFVTDRGANIKKALQNNVRYSCADHILHNIIKKAIDSVPEIKLILDSSKNLARYFKKSSICHKLKKSLKAECPTRWTSIYEMFSSIKENMKDIVEILNEKNESHRLQDINTHLLSEIVSFLKDFNTAFLQLQASKTCSIHMVYPIYNMLVKK